MMGSDEKKRIKELMKERERDDGMMDWMYKTAKPDAEEYLLGRKIDKIFEQEEEPPEDKNDPGAIFNERVKANIAMDMAAKMREDPLFQIKKREEEAKKTLLQNPVRMRQLQKLVKEKEKSKHKKKKKKHKKKKAESSDDESDDDDDGDDDIMKKYLAVLSKKHKPKSAETSGGGRQKQTDRGDNQEDDEDDSTHRPRKERKERWKKHSLSPEMSKNKNHSKIRERREHRKSSSPSPNHRKAGSKQYGLLLRGENLMVDKPSKRSKSPGRSRSRSFEQKRSPIRRKSPKVMSRSAVRKRSGSPERKRSRSHERRSRSPVRRRSRSPVRRRSRSPQRRRSGSPNRKHSRSPVRRRPPYTRRSRSPINERSRRASRSRSPSEKATKRKLTEEDKLRKLEEMQENAKWRDSQREKNVKRYRDEAEAEERSHLNKGSSADFLNPLMAGHVSQSSVQDRIKRNIYNVQRTKADLDKDFTRR